MTAVARVAAPLVLLGALAAVATAPQGAQPRRASPAAGAGLHRVGQLDAHAEVRVTLVLRPRAPGHMRRLLNGLEDPRSADYHRFAEARTFGARFGPSRIRLRRAASWLRAAGIRTRRVLPQRTVLEGEGSAEAVGRAFRVRFVAYADRRGRTFHAPIGTPRVPSALSRWSPSRPI